jgi:hypothetical protein
MQALIIWPGYLVAISGLTWTKSELKEASEGGIVHEM